MISTQHARQSFFSLKYKCHCFSDEEGTGRSRLSEWTSHSACNVNYGIRPSLKRTSSFAWSRVYTFELSKNSHIKCGYILRCIRKKVGKGSRKGCQKCLISQETLWLPYAKVANQRTIFVTQRCLGTQLSKKTRSIQNY